MSPPPQPKKPVVLNNEKCRAIDAVSEAVLRLRSIKKALDDTKAQEEVLAVIMTLRSAQAQLKQINIREG
jgi:hypothetical protein